MVPLLPVRAVLWSYWCHLRCTTGIGPWTDTLHDLHRWLGVDCFWTRPVAASTRCRYPNGFCRPISVSSLSSTVSQCVDNVSGWMCSNRLQLNVDKTEVMWYTSTHKLSQCPSSSFHVAGALVQQVDTVRDLGVNTNSYLATSRHVRRTVCRCFTALRHLLHFRRYVTDDCLHSLVVTCALKSRRRQFWPGRASSNLFLTPRLVWCIVCVVTTTSVAHCNIALVASARTGRLQGGYHGLFVLHGLAPPYLSHLVRVADLPGRRRLRSSSTQLHYVPPFRRSTVRRRSFPAACSIRSLELLTVGHSVIALFTHKVAAWRSG